MFTDDLQKDIAIPLELRLPDAGYFEHRLVARGLQRRETDKRRIGELDIGRN